MGRTRQNNLAFIATYIEYRKQVNCLYHCQYSWSIFTGLLSESLPKLVNVETTTVETLVMTAAGKVIVLSTVYCLDQLQSSPTVFF